MINSNNGMTGFYFRSPKLNTAEIELLNENKIPENTFLVLFDSIVLSEIKPNSIKESRRRRMPANGIIFCGKKIENIELLDLKEKLLDHGFELQATVDEMITSRFIDFEFPFYKEKENELLEISKNYYKIFPKKDAVDFVEQVQFPLVDKSELSNFYERLTKDYHCLLLWADGNENILYYPCGKSDELVNTIYEFRDKISPKKESIEKGFYTEASLKQEILNYLPLVSISFYE